MSSMAKIFVVVNLVLGVAVFGSAATLLGAQDDYKREFEKCNTQSEEVRAAKDKEINNLRKREGEAVAKASQADARANNAEAEAEQRKTELAAAKAANEKLSATVEGLSGNLTALTEINGKFQTAVEQATQEAQQATQDKLNYLKKFENETRARAQCEQTVSDLQEQIAELRAQLGDCQKKLRELEFENGQLRKVAGPIVGGGEGPPGRVTAVKGNLVTISVGSEDGVRRGDVYHIRRGSDYVGQITITNVYKGLSVGEFDDRFVGPGGSPQNGDTAYVR